MNLQGVFHSINSSYSYIASNCLNLVLRVTRGDASLAEVIYYNRFNSEAQNNKEMTLWLSDSMFDYYSICIKLEKGSLVYYFKISDGEQTIYFGECGIKKTPIGRVGSFEMLGLHNSEIYSPPAWLQNSIFYQIFPDRFNKVGGEKTVKKWGEQPDYYSIFGGNLQGISQKLDYISSLNINAIYLTPVFKSDSCHRYDIKDYYEVDERLGSKQDLKDFISNCHNRGMKVILDGVFNHCSDKFFAFEDVKKKNENSKYKDWFYIDSFPLKSGKEKNYATFASEENMPRLNTENSEVIDYFTEVGRYWTQEFAFDGWRLDVADEVSTRFWRRFKRELKIINSDIILLGEVWHNSTHWLGEEFDSAMNYAFRSLALDTMFNRPEEFRSEAAKMILRYPYNYQLAQMNVLSTHDAARTLTVLGDDMKKFKQALVFQMCFCGTPCIYYGDEIAMKGGDDPQNRQCMEWENVGSEFMIFCRELLAIRLGSRALREGEFHFVDSNCISFERTYEMEKIRVYVNTYGIDVKIDCYWKVLKSYNYDNRVLKNGGYIIFKK